MNWTSAKPPASKLSLPGRGRKSEAGSPKPASLHVLINNAGGAHGLDTDRRRQGRGLGGDDPIERARRVAHDARGAAAHAARRRREHHQHRFGGRPHGLRRRRGYCAAKAGELQITRALRLELLGTGIRVGTVDPGLAETEFSLVRFKGDAAGAKKVYEGTNPLTAEDIAEILVWIASRPPHVNIDELIVKPVDQAAVGKVFRRTRIERIDGLMD